MRLSGLSVLIIWVLFLQQITDSFPKRPRSHGRVFVRGKGATLTVSPGDTVVSSLILSTRTKNTPVHPPYRWFYAVNSDYFLLFTYHKTSWFTKTVPKLINRKSGKYAELNFKNRGKKKRHVGSIGSLVAILMAGRELPFHFLFCNSKHYVEYLSRGYAHGKWYKLLFNRTSKNCPVFAKLPSDLQSVHNVFMSRSFVLKDGHDNEIELGIDKWPDEALPPPPLVYG